MRVSRRRTTTAVVAGAIGALMLFPTASPASASVGRAPSAPGGGTPTPTPSGPAKDHNLVLRGGQFGVWNESKPPAAVTYDQKLVPTGARIAVGATSLRGTLVALIVTGLVPNRTYGAHVHVAACGATGAAAGPHYQHRADPVQPSVDPAYANPRNEVWLDFTTDSHGIARAFASVDWRFRPDGANAVVLHEHPTKTGHGEAGTAGGRLGCVTVPF